MKNQNIIMTAGDHAKLERVIACAGKLSDRARDEWKAQEQHREGLAGLKGSRHVEFRANTRTLRAVICSISSNGREPSANGRSGVVTGRQSQRALLTAAL